MPSGKVTRAAIVLLGAAALLFSLLYGPSRRTHVTPPRTVAIGSAAEIDGVWRDHAIHGRIAVFLARNLIPAEFGRSDAESAAAAPGIEAVGRATREGRVREIFHVIPDRAWPSLSIALPHFTIYWPTSTGFVGAFDDGRVNVLPLSRFWPSQEPVLLLVDARAWTGEELREIAARIRSGALRTDLIAVVNGAPSDLELLQGAQGVAAR